MPHFEWTGALRPEVISPRRHVPEDIRLPDYALDGVPRSEAQSAQRNTREFPSPSQEERHGCCMRN